MKERARHLIVFAALTVLAAIHTWPLLALRHTHIVDGEREDTWLNTWHISWWRDSVVNWHTPFFAPKLHYPVGAELYWHMMVPAKSLWGLLLPWFSVVELNNLITFWTFPFAGMAAWLLVRDVMRRSGREGTLADVAAFAGACVYTFSRYHLCHAHAHHNLSAMEGIPLFIWVVLRYFETKKRGWLVGAAFAALYCAACDLYYLYYVALFFVIWLVSTIWRDRPTLRDVPRHALIKPAIHIAIASAIGVLPLVLPIIAHMKPAPVSIHGDSMYPVDPLMFIVPDKLSRWTFLMPSGMAHAFAKLQNGILNDLEGGCFVGYATIALTVIAFRTERSKLRPWLDIGLLFFALSLGSFLNLGGVDDTFGFRIPMPYWVFKHVAPLFSRGGMPVRFTVMGELALAVIVPFGILALAKKWPKHAVAVAALAILAVNLDTLGKPMPMDEVKPLPPVFAEIRDDAEDVAVYSDHVLAQFEMQQHHRPISFARQSRIPIRELPFLESPLDRALVEFELDWPPETVAAMKDALRAGHFKYWVGHHRHAKEYIRWKKLRPTVDADRTRFIEQELGGKVIYNDDDYEVARFW